MAQQKMPRIETEPRQRVGSRYAARLREEGKLPVVVYGHGQEPVSVTVDNKKFIEVLHGNAHLVELAVDGKTEACLIKEVQWDHLGRKIIHVDLARVNLNEEVDVEVEVRFTGEPKALETPGAVLERPMSVIEVRCLASNIPEAITVDISNLGIDEAITVADLKLPEGVTTTADPETMVARIGVIEEAPTEEAAPAEEGGAEPEVIGRGKKDEEGEAAAE